MYEPFKTKEEYEAWLAEWLEGKPELADKSDGGYF